MQSVIYIFTYKYVHIKSAYVWSALCICYAVTEETIMCVTFNVSSTVSTYAYFNAYEILFSILNGPLSPRDSSNVLYILLYGVLSVQ